MKAKRWLKVIGPLALLTALLLVLAPVQLFASTAQSKGNCRVGSSSFPTIQSAVNDFSCSRIDVPAGTFYENVRISRDVTIKGEGNKTIVDGDRKGIVFIVRSGTVTFEGMTITHGSTSIDVGGGIWSSGGALTVKNCTISDNFAFFGGGGIYTDAGVTLTVENSTISNNGTARYGGGIQSNGTLTVKNSTITNNTAYKFGGGIAHRSGTLTVKNSTITNNTARERGGGIYNVGSTLTVKHSTITNNTPDDIYP